MKLTVREISDLGYWDEYCELTGTSVWAKNEGQIRSEEKFTASDLPDNHKNHRSGGNSGKISELKTVGEARMDDTFAGAIS